MSRRLRLAESDLKIKEQRHALKVELLEKRALLALLALLAAVRKSCMFWFVRVLARRAGCCSDCFGCWNVS